MSPNSTRAFAARITGDEAFRTRVAEDPRAALAEYGLAVAPGLIPDVIALPSRQELAALGFGRKPEPTPPEPTPPPPPKPKPTPSINVQLFDPS